MLSRLATTVLTAMSLVWVMPATATAVPCPDVDLVFARGTGEPPGMGRVGLALAAALPPVLGGRTLGTYAVSYPANHNFLSTQSGADYAAEHLARMAENCPATRIVLGVSRRALRWFRCSPGCRRSGIGSAASGRRLRSRRRWPAT